MSEPRTLIDGAIPFSLARSLVFAALLVPMAIGFGWETAVAIRDSREIQSLSLGRLDQQDLRAGYVELTGFDQQSAKKAGHFPVEQPNGSWKSAYVRLQSSDGPAATNSIVLAKLSAFDEAGIDESLSTETLRGLLRYPYRSTPVAADEAMIAAELAPGTSLRNVWIFDPKEPDQSQNPWYIFLRSLLIVSGIAGILIMVPAKEPLFSERGHRIASLLGGSVVALLGAYILFELPRGPATWNAHSPPLAMYMMAMGTGMSVVALAYFGSDVADSRKSRKIEASNELDVLHELGPLRFEYKEIDDLVGAIAFGAGMLIYLAAIWSVPIPTLAKFAGVVPVMIVSLSVCYLFPNGKSILRFHERGIEIDTRAQGSRTIPFTEIDHCRADIVHQLQHGVYTGTRIDLWITERGQVQFRHNISVRRDTLGYERALELIKTMGSGQQENVA